MYVKETTHRTSDDIGHVDMGTRLRRRFRNSERSFFQRCYSHNIDSPRHTIHFPEKE